MREGCTGDGALLAVGPQDHLVSEYEALDRYPQLVTRLSQHSGSIGVIKPVSVVTLISNRSTQQQQQQTSASAAWWHYARFAPQPLTASLAARLSVDFPATSTTALIHISLRQNFR